MAIAPLSWSALIGLQRGLPVPRRYPRPRVERLGRTGRGRIRPLARELRGERDDPAVDGEKEAVAQPSFQPGGDAAAALQLRRRLRMGAAEGGLDLRVLGSRVEGQVERRLVRIELVHAA